MGEGESVDMEELASCAQPTLRQKPERRQGNKIFTLSLMQNHHESDIPYSVPPLGLWFVPTAKLVLYVPYPHPYFRRNRLVFLRIQAWYRCKIFITKELPAKSSRIRS
jgi:hypothetical protein